MRARNISWILVFAPIVASAALAGVLVAAGEKRILQIGLSIPLVSLLIGISLSCVAGGVLLARAARRRSHLRVSVAVSDATDEGVRREREQHRRFLARLDHELKNPIMAIRAQAAAADVTPAWRTVDAQAAKLGTLVRDLRKLAELETRPLEYEQVDMEALVRESINAIIQQYPAAADRFAVTVTRVPWPLPPVTADLDLLSIVIDNVLSNAVKYSASGAIEVRLREQEGMVVIEVADNGRGIPAEDLPQVFDELARARNARDIAGSGLGLTLVGTVLRRHGGDVQVKSVLDAGTLVVMRIPVTAG